MLLLALDTEKTTSTSRIHGEPTGESQGSIDWDVVTSVGCGISNNALIPNNEEWYLLRVFEYSDQTKIYNYCIV